MSRKLQALLASCLLGGSLILIGALGYLAFVFPGTVAAWTEQHRHLNAAEQLMVQLSNLAKTLGLPVIGMLILPLVTSLMWMALAMQAKRQ